MSRSAGILRIMVSRDNYILLQLNTPFFFNQLKPIFYKMLDFYFKIFLVSILFIGIYQIGKQVNNQDKTKGFYAWFFLVFGIIIYFVIDDFIYY